MYAHFSGEFSAVTPTMAVVECHGVAYELHISLYTFEQIKNLSQGKLLAHLSIKEDAHVLYGFFDETERDLFRHLISVQGIGAATSRMILSSLNPDEISRAILEGNVALLKSVKGVGPKSAQRLILELQDKMRKAEVSGGFSMQLSSLNKDREEAVAALQMLGFAKATVEKVVQKICDENKGQTPPVEEIIKIALKRL